MCCQLSCGFKASGGYIREVLSHFIFVVERLFGEAKVNFSHPTYPDDSALCETHLQAKLVCGTIPINIFGSCGGHGPDRQEITIWGARKSAKISDFYLLEISENEKWSTISKTQSDPRTACSVSASELEAEHPCALSPP